MKKIVFVFVFCNLKSICIIIEKKRYSSFNGFVVPLHLELLTSAEKLEKLSFFILKVTRLLMPAQ